MIKLVVIGGCDGQLLSAELAHAREKMWRLLPIGVPVVEVGGTTLREWVGQAEGALAQLASSDTVLFVRNPFLLWGDRTLALLAAGLPVTGAVCAYDSRAPFMDFPPNYLTLRGIERYVAGLTRFSPVTRALPSDPALLLVRRQDLADEACWQSSCFLPAAYAHDFAAYHQGKREEVLPLVPETARVVLDVGGGEGGFLEALKAARDCETHLAEFSPTACAQARSRVDQVWQGDFLSTEFDRHFDCISFLDVLEHTEAPLDWLRKAVSLLNPGGTILASIPNIGHWSVIADLLEGRWDYVPAGIHCITHLRFFTRHGVLQLLDEADLAVDRLETTEIPPPKWFEFSAPLNRTLAIDRGSFSAYAFLVAAKVR